MDARVNPDGNRGPVTWQGQTYEGVFWSGDLFFDAGTATAGFGVEATSPFAFAGTLTAFSDDSRSTALFTTALTGSGTAWIRFYDFDPAIVDGNEVATVRYTFEADAAPVPEPATLLLVGGGIAGALGARRRRMASAARG
jgi:hypothetical protein